MSNYSRKISRNSFSNLFSSLVSLDRRQGNNNIDDDWEHIEIVDRELGSGDEDENASINEVASEIGDQEKDNSANYKMKYTILSKAEIRQRLEDKITKVSTVLLLPRNEAAILLQHFKWCVNGTNDEWLACEEKVRKAVGLFMRPVDETPANAAEIACRRCHGDFQRDSTSSVSCGHQICNYCWEDYIREAINDGPRCLTLRCPESFCDAAVGFHLIEQLRSEEDKIKFENHLLRSYLAGSCQAKWCPAPDCNYVVFSSNGGEGTVTCRCLHSFCWSCSREAHAPVDCNTVAEWMSEGPLQSEIWLLANVVTCPNCKWDYENEFCLDYVYCTVCKHEFCSVCGDYWNGGIHGTSCNGSRDNDVAKLKSLQKYVDHNKGWTACESSRAIALSDLKVFQDLQLNRLCARFGLPSTEFDFLVEALGQVVECWQILKWTHVYRYYLPDDERAKKQLLEFMQEESTRLVSTLLKHVEELQDFLHEDVLFVQFKDFQSRTTKLTRVIRNYFHQFVEDVMDGLPEVVSIPKFNPSLKMSRERRESTRLKMSRERVENSCSQKSPNASPSYKFMRVEGDVDISTLVGSTMSDDSWGIPEPELENDIDISSPVGSIKSDDSWVIPDSELEPKSKID